MLEYFDIFSSKLLNKLNELHKIKRDHKTRAKLSARPNMAKVKLLISQ